MQFAKFLLATPLLISGCQTPLLNREPPAPVIVYRSPVLPVECASLPVEPEPVDEVALPVLPAPDAPAYPAIRARRAELAGLYYQGLARSEQSARVTNAADQLACATWVRSNRQEPVE